MNLLIFASGKGSNFEAIVKASQKGYLPAKVLGLVCDKECPAIEIAKENSIPCSIVAPKNFIDKNEYIKKLIELVAEYAPDYIVLAGYMRIIPSELIDLYPLKIINIHPSILPAFPGVDSIKRAWEAKVKVTGATVHYVNDRLDQGAIIDQGEILVPDTLENLEAAIHELEHKIYPAAIKKIEENSYDVLVVSSCLLGVNCRYDGKNKFSKRVKKFVDNFRGEIISVCPEIEAGFLVPRDRITLVDGKAIMENNNVDVSAKILAASDRILQGIDKKRRVMAIVKERSSSCGLMPLQGLFTERLFNLFKDDIFVITEEDL